MQDCSGSLFVKGLDLFVCVCKLIFFGCEGVSIHYLLDLEQRVGNDLSLSPSTALSFSDALLLSFFLSLPLSL